MAAETCAAFLPGDVVAGHAVPLASAATIAVTPTSMRAELCDVMDFLFTIMGIPLGQPAAIRPGHVGGVALQMPLQSAVVIDESNLPSPKCGGRAVRVDLRCSPLPSPYPCLSDLSGHLMRRYNRR